MIKIFLNKGQTLILAAASVWVFTTSPLRASDIDDRSESSAKQSYAVKPGFTNDASITAQVKTSLLSLRSTSELKTKVETANGVVTLTGVAKTTAEKALLTKLASDIKGVSGVSNNMTIQAAVSNSHSPPLPPQNLRIVTQ